MMVVTVKQSSQSQQSRLRLHKAAHKQMMRRERSRQRRRRIRRHNIGRSRCRVLLAAAAAAPFSAGQAAAHPGRLHCLSLPACLSCCSPAATGLLAATAPEALLLLLAPSDRCCYVVDLYRVLHKFTQGPIHTLLPSWRFGVGDAEK